MDPYLYLLNLPPSPVQSPIPKPTKQQLKKQYEQKQQQIPKKLDILFEKFLNEKEQLKTEIDNFKGDINTKEFFDLLSLCYLKFDEFYRKYFKVNEESMSLKLICNDLVLNRYNFVEFYNGEVIIKRSYEGEQIEKITPWKKSIFCRYPDIFPINNAVNIDKNFDYNASIINSDGFNYIASQCPMENFDICLFLKMLIDNDIKLINIPSPFDPNKMFKWFPSDKNETKDFMLQNIKVNDEIYNFNYELICEKSNINHTKFGIPTKKTYESIISYDIKIIDKERDLEHQIKILQYDNWPDQDVPTDNYLLFQYIYKIFRFISKNHYDKMLTHCSAGVGRTGTVLCCVEMLRYINKKYFNFETKSIINEYFNISNKNDILKELYKYLFDFMYELRLFRPYMVQKPIQFKTIIIFIHNVISLCLSDTYLIEIEQAHPLEQQNEEYNTYKQNKRKELINRKQTEKSKELFDVFRPQSRPPIFDKQYNPFPSI